MESSPTAMVAGVLTIARDSVGSTNDECLALARGRENGPLWITARRQSGGRGRRGRNWQSPPGNLYASLLLVDACTPRRAPQLSFVAALALSDALADLTPNLTPRLSLKWPNDVLVGGAKVAGILVEGEALADARFAAVIGIGVNCASHPDDTSYPTTDLNAEGAEAAVDCVFEKLAPAMQVRLAQWNRGEGFSATRDAWLARAAWMGETVTVRAPQEAEGRFAGIDEEGRLLLRLDDGSIRAFAAGEVTRPLAPARQEIIA